MEISAGFDLKVCYLNEILIIFYVTIRYTIYVIRNQEIGNNIKNVIIYLTV